MLEGRTRRSAPTIQSRRRLVQEIPLRVLDGETDLERAKNLGPDRVVLLFLLGWKVEDEEGDGTAGAAGRRADGHFAPEIRVEEAGLAPGEFEVFARHD